MSELLKLPMAKNKEEETLIYCKVVDNIRLQIVLYTKNDRGI
jgi:hypothetical protein